MAPMTVRVTVREVRLTLMIVPLAATTFSCGGQHLGHNQDIQTDKQAVIIPDVYTNVQCNGPDGFAELAVDDCAICPDTGVLYNGWKLTLHTQTPYIHEEWEGVVDGLIVVDGNLIWSGTTDIVFNSGTPDEYRLDGVSIINPKGPIGIETINNATLEVGCTSDAPSSCLLGILGGNKWSCSSTTW